MSFSLFTEVFHQMLLSNFPPKFRYSKSLTYSYIVCALTVLTFLEYWIESFFSLSVMCPWLSHKTFAGIRQGYSMTWYVFTRITQAKDKDFLCLFSRVWAKTFGSLFASKHVLHFLCGGVNEAVSWQNFLAPRAPWARVQKVSMPMPRYYRRLEQHPRL